MVGESLQRRRDVFAARCRHRPRAIKALKDNDMCTDNISWHDSALQLQSFFCLPPDRSPCRWFAEETVEHFKEFKLIPPAVGAGGSARVWFGGGVRSVSPPLLPQPSLCFCASGTILTCKQRGVWASCYGYRAAPHSWTAETSNAFPALMKCTAACSTFKPNATIAKQHPFVICHNYCWKLLRIEMLEHKSFSSTASQ